MKDLSYFTLIYDAVSVEAELGAGGSGAVYKAWHNRLQKHVVIKEFKHPAESGAEARRNEVEALKNIKCAFVPQVLDYLMEGDRSFTIMEFIEGESFDKLLRRGRRFREAQVLEWYGQLACALEAIHRQGVCHRDIKPANIMLTPAGDACLIDFNAAVVGAGDTRLVSRSLGYASPEQYKFFQSLKKLQEQRQQQRKKEPPQETPKDKTEDAIDYIETQLLETDSKTKLTPAPNSQLSSLNSQLPPALPDWKRSDIYSLGATMHHLLTGKRPPMYAEVFVQTRIPGSLGRGLSDVIGRSMRISPEERFASAAQLAEALRNIEPAGRRRTMPKKAAAIATLVAITALIVLMKNQSWRGPRENL